MKAFVTANLDPESLKRLETKCQVVYESWRSTNEIYFDSKKLLEKLQGMDIFITEADELKDDLIQNCNLKIIAACRHDPYKINVKAATEKKIPVIFTPARNADSVADLTVLMMMSLLRKLTQADRFLHSDKFSVVEFEDWIKIQNDFVGAEMKDKVVGIIGFGNIGQKVGQRVQAFGAKILVADPFANEKVVKNYGKLVDLETLAKESDIITIHAAPMDGTDEMINSDIIGLMKPTALFINTAKASMVETDALLSALEEKKIAGAGLDVFDIEPLDEDNDFLKLDNVICLPHFGGNTVDTVKRQSKMIVDDILAILDKQEPKNILNPEVLGIKKKDNKIMACSQDILECCLTLVKEGLVAGKSGNVSMRVPGEDKMIITPSQLDYEIMTVNDLMVLDFDGNVVSGIRNPSIEKDLHLSIYRKRKDVGAIIHSHGVNSIAFSLTQSVLPPIVEEFVPYIGGPVKVAEYAEAGSKELANNVLEALGDNNAAIAAMHGNVCCGSHMQGALTVLRMMERVIGIYLKAAPLGKPRELPEDVVDYEKDMYEVFKDDKKV